ncbi:MAG: hypothetical protein KDC10_06705 [Calditrichaeota bacterium]|nr:hypothetical protein [Candidatus Cloacimonadota bacterium]MCA9785985.1 hypothetical protein [Candidatus Cloacimonadota bacterium]MCB1046876.1 hypothetical protein [Calditrichota bacterium]MCB9475130.1 hypothetical protein [Candidatus Delongbacteria bacterium]
MTDSEPRCSCGHTTDHKLVTRRVEYSWLGWLMIFVGISAHPLRVRYQCLKCDQVLHVESDPRVIRDKRRHD